MLCEISLQLLHHISAPDKKRSSLMKLIGFYVKDRPSAVCRLSTGDFSNKCERIALIQQPEFAARFIDCAWIHENATLYQVAMNISHHAADISLSVWSAIGFCFFLADIDISPHGSVVLKKISMINGINFSRERALDAWMA